MRPGLLLASSFAVGVLTAGCGNSVGSGPCVGASVDPICNQECDPVANPCPSGFHCADDGTCNAECEPDGSGCAADHFCNPDGRCEQLVDADCPDVTLTTERTIPSVQLVIDQSGSMTEGFGGTNRWDAVEDALVDPDDGVVSRLESTVYFGASLYTGTNNTCPRLLNDGTGRSLNNRAAIATLLGGNDPASETPTGEALDAVIDGFIADPPPAGSPAIIVLATDGEPDTCAEPNPQNGQPEAVAAATRAFANDIRLYILSVGSDVGAPHLQDMANAGVGNDPQQSGMQAPYFVANNPAELSSQLEAIIGGIVSCELVLDGVVDAAAANQGVVTLNGMNLVQGVDWELVGNDTIRLLGSACDQLLSDENATVNATFPCGVVIK